MPVYSLSRRAPSADSDISPRSEAQCHTQRGHSYTKRQCLSSPAEKDFAASVHVQGAHVDDAVNAVGIEGRAQSGDTDERHDGLHEQG